MSEPDSKKRKRSALADGELEIDVTQPEPLSRKEARRAKKGKTAPATAESDIKRPVTAANSSDATSAQIQDTKPAAASEPKRSDYGIWIGNLSFATDKSALRTFLTEKGGITEESITRIHMPVPTAGRGDAPRVKPQNKGFAYVDFDTAASMQLGLALTETLLGGRKVLIKDAKSFSGRPEKSADAGASAPNQKPPSKRVFVGNLAFDVTKESLSEHFSQAGEVEHIHLATFEDTGKCKGFAWVTFAEQEAATAAVTGYIMKYDPPADGGDAEKDDQVVEAKDSDAESDDDANKGVPAAETKQASNSARKRFKPRKWFINRINGRSLRSEYAEDATTRYNKRYKTNKPDQVANGTEQGTTLQGAQGVNGADNDDSAQTTRKRPRGDKDERADQRRQKHVDARNIRPGAALANAPRASGAIVAGSGAKIKFDE